MFSTTIAGTAPARACSGIRRLNTKSHQELVKLNQRHNAFVHLPPFEANPYYKSSNDSGTLASVSIGLKDLFCASKMPTTCCSKMLEGYMSPFDSTVLSLLVRDGASILGKTNMDEFGMGSYNLYSKFGPTVNPLSEESEPRVAGGSSGGGAAAVAADMVDVAITSDTGGSTRLPASYCNIFGFKPTYGLISRWGMVSYASSLDCVGIMSNDVDMLQKTFKSLEESDPKDSTSLSEEVRQLIRQLEGEPLSLDGIRIGIPKEFFPKEISPDALSSFSAFLRLLQSAGAHIIPVSHPSAGYGLSAYYVIATAEASSNLAKYDGVRYGFRSESASTGQNENLGQRAELYAATRREGFGEEVRKRILLGTHALSADAFENYFLQAQEIRKRIIADYNSLFAAPHLLQPLSTFDSSTSSQVDFLLHLSTINSAPLIKDCEHEQMSNNEYVQDILTVPASLAGLPAISMPFGRSAVDGFPIGFQLIGQWGSDYRLLKLANTLHRLHHEAGIST